MKIALKEDSVVYMIEIDKNITHVRPDTVKKDLNQRVDIIKVERTGNSLRIFCSSEEDKKRRTFFFFWSVKRLQKQR